MDALFRLNPPSLGLRPGVKVIKAGDAAEWLDGQRMLTELQTCCEITRREAEAEATRVRRVGYEEGLEEGRQEYAEKMLETVLSSVEFIESMEQRLVDVVTQSVNKVIGELDDDERIVRVVRQALHTVRHQQHVTLRVAVDDEKVLSEALAPLLQASPGAAAFLHIETDPRLERGSCLLESSMGVVDAGLETQLRALENAFRAKVAS